MAQTTTDGQGKSTVITPEDHDTTRRRMKAKKRAHRGRGKNGYTRETLIEGVRSDRLATRGLAMLDRLERTMHSDRQETHDQLVRVTTTYVGNFADAKWHSSKSDWQRHLDAAAEATAHLSGSLAGYAKRELKAAFNATKRR